MTGKNGPRPATLNWAMKAARTRAGMTQPVGCGGDCCARGGDGGGIALTSGDRCCGWLRAASVGPLLPEHKATAPPRSYDRWSAETADRFAAILFVVAVVVGGVWLLRWLLGLVGIGLS